MSCLSLAPQNEPQTSSGPLKMGGRQLLYMRCPSTHRYDVERNVSAVVCNFLYGESALKKSSSNSAGGSFLSLNILETTGDWI